MLLLERIEGGRLFDVIRHLRGIATDPEREDADAAVALLLGQARSRLAEVQLALADLVAGDMGAILVDGPYPLDVKATSLLEMFIRVLRLEDLDVPWRRDLDDLSEYWESECSMIPFRDATTKNMFVADPRFALLGGGEDDADAKQREAIVKVLESEPAEYWGDVPLVDVDFSSVVNFTSIEDDPISLHCHQWTYSSITPKPAAFVLDQRLGEPNARRAATTAFVRYLRFGGRKLAYFLINSQGFKVRFAYDDPLFYFRTFRPLCDELHPGFSEEYAGLFGLTDAIWQEVAGASQADREALSIDHLRKHGGVGHFWQQNPIENT